MNYFDVRIPILLIGVEEADCGKGRNEKPGGSTVISPKGQRSDQKTRNRPVILHR